MKKIFIILILLFILLPFQLSFNSYAAEQASAEQALEESSENLEDDGMIVKEESMRTLSLAGGDTSGGSVGGGASLSPLLSESFQTDLATGSATLSVPIVVPPGRKNMQPSLGLSYSSSNSNGVCGVGWGLTTSSVQRSTKQGLPKYDDTDTFIFSSSGSTGELVLIDAEAGEYRQKIETAFMRYIYDSANSKWSIWDKNGTKYIFGESVDSRIVNSDGTKIFAWFLDRVEDVYGNTVSFIYEKDESQVYLSRVEYTSNALVSPALSADKSIEFIYETDRPDAMRNYRSGWEIETKKRLKDILVKTDGAIVWRYELDYENSIDTGRSLLTQVTLFDAEGNSLPPKKFTYQTVE